VLAAAVVFGVATVAAIVGAAGDDPPRDGQAASTGEEIVIHRSPTCSCCGAYEDHLRDEGFTVRTELVDDPAAVRDRFGVPEQLASCHTATVGGYVVEGHVPVAAIDRLLSERPALTGIALPGMPPGAPGMGGTEEGPLEVLSFAAGTTEPYMAL
jgi:hypothetical protein